MDKNEKELLFCALYYSMKNVRGLLSSFDYDRAEIDRKKYVLSINMIENNDLWDEFWAWVDAPKHLEAL